MKSNANIVIGSLFYEPIYHSLWISSKVWEAFTMKSNTNIVFDRLFHEPIYLSHFHCYSEYFFQASMSFDTWWCALVYNFELWLFLLIIDFDIFALLSTILLKCEYGWLKGKIEMYDFWCLHIGFFIPPALHSNFMAWFPFYFNLYTVHC